jgi:phasin
MLWRSDARKFKQNRVDRESAMITSTTPQLEIPSEMRAVAERSIQRAKLAFDNYIRATEGAASMVEERVEASQVGAQEVGKKAMEFALRNAISAFEFAQKIVQAKSIIEFARLLNDFLQSQTQVLSEQVKDLGEALSKVAMDGLKTSRTGDLSS